MKQTDETYVNGQIKQELAGETMTHYFKNGRIKAKGPYINGKMEGRWEFFRETGELWQTGELVSDVKHGEWVRYDRDGNEEYRETFTNGKIDQRKGGSDGDQTSGRKRS